MNAFKNLFIVLLIGLIPATNLLPAAQHNNAAQAATLQCASCTYHNPPTTTVCEVCGELLNQSEEKNDNDREVKIQNEHIRCAICLDDDSNEPMAVLHQASKNNNHSFHRDSIIQHLYHQLNCPLCRKPISLDASEENVDQLALHDHEIATITTNLAEKLRIADEERAERDREEILAEQLLNAAANGDLPLLLETLELGANVNAQDGNNNTPLHFACINEHIEIVQQLLIDSNIDIEIRNNEDKTAFFCSIINNNTEIMEFLLIHKPSIINSVMSLKNKQSNKKILNNNALHIAVHCGAQDALSLLLAQGAHSNARNSNDQTPLHMMVKDGRIEMTRQLLKQPGVEIDPVDIYGFTPFLYAIIKNNLTIMELLLAHGANFTITGTIKKRNASTSRTNNNAAHYAVLYKRKEILIKLIELSAENECFDINAQNDKGETPLDFARHKELNDFIILLNDALEVKKQKIIAQELHQQQLNQRLLEAANDGDVSEIICALEQEADINAGDADGNRPLHFACIHGHKETVELLLNQHDIDVEAKNNDGLTAFFAAIAYNHMSIVHLFITRYPSIINSLTSIAITNSAQKIINNNALHFASLYNAKDVLLLLLETQLNINAQNSKHETPLHIATSNGMIQIVHLLLQQRTVNINALAKYNITPFLSAVIKNNTPTMELLFIYGADITAIGCVKNSRSGGIVGNNNAFHYAVFNNNKEALLRLIRYSQNNTNLNINARNDEGRTPLDYAYNDHLDDLIIILQDAGAICSDEKEEAHC